jgi:hypothetical protein
MGSKEGMSYFEILFHSSTKKRKTKSLFPVRAAWFDLIVMYLTCTIIVLLNQQIDLYIANRVCLSKLGQVLKVIKYIPLF